MRKEFLDFRDPDDKLEVEAVNEKIPGLRYTPYVGFYSHGYIALNKASVRRLIKMLTKFANQ